MSDLLAVCLGAAVGAPARYLVDRAIQSRHESPVPWGTLTVNVVGSLLFGLLAGLLASGDGVPPPVVLLVGTGFCGVFTTYSTFAYETFRLVENGRWPIALLNGAVSLAGGMGAAGTGYVLGTLF